MSKSFSMPMSYSLPHVARPRLRQGLRWGTFFRKSLPYCFDKMKSNAYPHVWLPLNRDYKPLVCLNKNGDWVDYNKYISHALVFSRDPCTFKDVWHSVLQADSKQLGACYLYNDGIDLDVEYFPRLQRLLSHTHKFYGNTKEPMKIVGVDDDHQLRFEPVIAKWNKAKRIRE